MKTLELRLAYIRTVASVIGALSAIAGLLISAANLWIMLHP
jgi:hypothetical protein